VDTISNIKRYRVGESKHNTLLRCKVSPGRQHVSALYYKAIIRSDKVKTKEEIIMLHIAYIQGGSNMTGTDLCVNKPHCAAAVRP